MYLSEFCKLLTCDVKISNHDYKEKQDPMRLKSGRDLMLFIWDFMFINRP